MIDIHDKIKYLREERNFKQRQVADFLGISQQAYSYYELDKRELPARHIVGLAKLYQVSTDFLLGADPTPSGSYDVNATFIQGVSLKEVMISLGQLNKDNRQEIIKYLSYLNSPQEKEPLNHIRTVGNRHPAVLIILSKSCKPEESGGF